MTSILSTNYQINDFWNEAQNLAGLHHPNVVAFYGVVLDSPGGSVATVTEYMVNGSLRNALQKNVRYCMYTFLRAMLTLRFMLRRMPLIVMVYFSGVLIGTSAC